MQNPWIFNEYVQWTSPPLSFVLPLSFVSPMQDVGKQIFTTLANFPHILFSQPRTKSTIQFGMSYEASIRPSLSLCIQDLMDGSSDGLAMPINCIFGIQAPHVQAKDIFASIMMATNRADWGDGQMLLSALDIPFTANSLGKCQLDANPYDSDNQYICAQNTEGQINWGGCFDTRWGYNASTHQLSWSRATYVPHPWSKAMASLASDYSKHSYASGS